MQSNRFANVLKGLGVGKDTRAFVMLPRTPNGMLGLMKVGAVPMPATTLCTPGDIEYQVNEAEAVLAHGYGELGQGGRDCRELLNFGASVVGRR